jgi:phage shock protein E
MLRTTALVVILAAAGCSKKSDAPASATAAKTAPSTPARPGKNPENAKKLIAAGAPVIDVRPATEFAADHLPNAVNIPVTEISTRLAEVDKLVAGDKTKPIVLHCMAGGMASKAKRELEAAGFSNVENGGGIDDLR